MARKTEYQKYLESPRWKQLRAEAIKRDCWGCVFCGNDIEHVHHVKYPKVLGEETVGDLISVCKICHDKCHGINIDKQPEKLPVEVYREKRSSRYGLIVSIIDSLISSSRREAVGSLEDGLMPKSTSILFDTMSDIKELINLDRIK